MNNSRLPEWLGLLAAWAHTQLDGMAAPNSVDRSSGSASKKRARRRYLRHQSSQCCGGTHTKHYLATVLTSDALERGPCSSLILYGLNFC